MSQSTQVGTITTTAEDQALSIGRLIARDKFEQDPLIPDELKSKFPENPHYLLIFIPRDDLIKLSIFPCATPEIKKVLIKLEEFSPDLVKNISGALRELKLTDHILHTTGLCFSTKDLTTNCYYEMYVDVHSFGQSFPSQGITDVFSKVPEVIDVILEDVPQG